MKRVFKTIKILTLSIAVVVLTFVFSACSISIDPNTLVPELFVNTDANLEYITSDEIYRIELLPGETYEIDADLGTYDGTEYYIEYSLENEEGLLTIEENKITVSANISQETTEKVFVKLKKNDDEKTYQTETIEILIVFDKTE